jgi:electron transport complex protein RnfE
MIICRCEVCASKQGPLTALADAVGNSLGFLLALGSVATVREILGMGTWLGIPVLPESFPRFVLMIMPPGAFLALGLLLAAVTAAVSAMSERKAKQRQASVAESVPAQMGEGS